MLFSVLIYHIPHNTEPLHQRSLSTNMSAHDDQDINLKFGVELEFFVNAVDPGPQDINENLPKERATLRLISEKLGKRVDNKWIPLFAGGRSEDYSKQWIVKREGNDQILKESEAMFETRRL
jgi:hypothetical protein